MVETAAARQLSLADLEGEHHERLVRAIARILATELAETTYAQIIDGLPTGDVAYDGVVPRYDGHPIDHAHDELCPDMLDKSRKLRDGFRPEILTFNSQVEFDPIPNSWRIDSLLIGANVTHGDSWSTDIVSAPLGPEDSRRV